MTLRDQLAAVDSGQCRWVNHRIVGPLNRSILKDLQTRRLINAWLDDGSSGHYYLTPKGARLLEGREAA